MKLASSIIITTITLSGARTAIKRNNHYCDNLFWPCDGSRRVHGSSTTPTGAPVPDSKHSKAGLTVRQELLAAVGITLPRARVLPPGIGEDDLLDAAAVAWSAHRIAAGTAEILSDPAQRADDGTEIAIAY